MGYYVPFPPDLVELVPDATQDRRAWAATDVNIWNCGSYWTHPHATGTGLTARLLYQQC
jgi:hypothetical protein